jgi:hypothetical protein
MSICLGRGFTFKNLKKKYLLNGLAYSCLIGFIFSSIFLNGFYATYRSVLEANQVIPPLIDIVQKTLDIFTLNYPFSDLKSHITFIMTLLFSIGAFVEGYFWSDPVPGYESLDRAQKDLQIQIDEVEFEILEAEKNLRTVYDDHYKNSIQDIKDFSPGVGAELVTKITNLNDQAKIIEENVNQKMSEWAISYMSSFQEINNSRIDSTQFQDHINSQLKYTRLTSRLEELNLRLVNEINSINSSYEEYLKSLDMNRVDFLALIDSENVLDENDDPHLQRSIKQKSESQISEFQ